MSYLGTAIRPFLYAIRPTAVAADRTVETPMNFRRPPTEGRFLSQKVVWKGSAGISCREDRVDGVGLCVSYTETEFIYKKDTEDSPTRDSGSVCQIWLEWSLPMAQRTYEKTRRCSLTPVLFKNKWQSYLPCITINIEIKHMAVYLRCGLTSLAARSPASTAPSM